MTSLVRSARIQAFTAGTAAAAAMYVLTKTHVQDVVAATAAQLPGAPPPRPPKELQQEPEMPLTATAGAWAVRKWNEGVDAVFKPVVQALAKRDL